MKYIEKGTYAFIVTGMFIFILGFKVANYNLYFWICGLLLFSIGFLTNILLDRKGATTKNNEYEIRKENLIKNGLKIEVDLSKVEIKSSDYREQIIDNGYSELSTYKALDALTGKDNREYNDIKESILIYQVQVVEDNFKFYSPVIPKDAITLQFLLNNQKKTFIYQDKLDKNNYFFDIEFLYK